LLGAFCAPTDEFCHHKTIEFYIESSPKSHTLSSTGVIVDLKRLDRLFTDAVRGCDVIADKDLEYALGFQSHAKKKTGRAYPIDRILLKFGFLEEVQVQALYKAIRYFRWRKEDKFFLKIAIQSKLMTEKRSYACLQEQKELYKERDELIRVNEIARRRVYLTEKQETAVIEAMQKCKGTTITVTEITLDTAENAPKLAPRKRSKTEKKENARSVAPTTKSKTPEKARRSTVDPFDDMASDIDAEPSVVSSPAPKSAKATLPDLDDRSEEGFDPLASSGAFAPVSSDEDDDPGFLPLSDEDDDPGFLPLSDEDDGSSFVPFDSDEDDSFVPLGSEEDDAFRGFDSEESDLDHKPTGKNGNFDAYKTEDELDSLLPLHEGDHIDNLAQSRRKKAKEKKAKEKKGKEKRVKGSPKTKAKKGSKPAQTKSKSKKKRRDPFAGNDGKSMKVLSDDDLDALWDEADLEDIDLDSDNRNVAPSPLLDSDDDLDYSSSDDLF
jgi:hypothetical protein